MKTLSATAAFIATWTILDFILGFAISLVFNVDYIEVVTSGPFITIVSIIGAPIISGYVADEVYTTIVKDQA